MKSLQGLYAITDEHLISPDVFSQAIEAALKGGARIIQYRDKSHDRQKRLQQARQLKQLCDQYQATSIINDDVALACEVDADGVHLGLDDMTLADARKRLGENKIIGVSCYNKIELAHQARQAGADYIAFGRFFSSKIKPDAVQASVDLFAQAADLQLPVCAIGGIEKNNGKALVDGGADMLAVISGVFADGDIERNCRDLSRLFE